MRTPPDAEIAAPEFPQGLDWLNVATLRMQNELGRQAAVLIEFWDFARINSLRTLPYVKEWNRRYADRGLRVIGVHSPGYSFGRDRETVERAVERLAITHAVLLDPHFQVWQLYGNKGWPARYLFDRSGWLRFVHYGEGEYLETELAIQDLLREQEPGVGLPEPMEPLRPEDAPGVRMQPQTADIVLPKERDRLELVRDWTDGEDYIEAVDAGAGAKVKSYTAAEAWAVLSNAVEPGLYKTEGTIEADDPGLRLHGIQFTPVPPEN